MSANFSPDLVGYSGIKPFRFWCQKVLPLTYDDSLSYYELLCKVVDYLNHAIEDLSAAETNIENLKDAFDELENYVNTAYQELKDYMDHYFDNLDVQEEIDNKLDEMASDGSLLATIQPYISELEDMIAAQNTRINAINSRVDTIASLPAGSTSGDAELADIRVAYDGVGYADAGASVRTQAEQLKTAILQRDENVYDIDAIVPTIFEGSAISYLTGGVSTNESYDRTDFIDVTDYDVLEYSRLALTGGGNAGLAFYTDSNVSYFIPDSGVRAYTNVAVEGYVNELVEVPSNAKYVRMTFIHEVSGYTIKGYKSKVLSLENRVDTLEDKIGLPFYIYDVDYTIAGQGTIRYDDGVATTSSATFQRTDWIDVTGVDYIKYSRVVNTASSARNGMAFYSSEYVGDYVDGEQCLLNGVEYKYEESIVAVPANARFARFTILQNVTGFYVKLLKHEPYMLKGKKLSLLGDSISAYEGLVPEGNRTYYTGENAGVSNSSQMYWNVLCSLTGMTPLVIDAWSGSAVTQLEVPDHVDRVPMSSDLRTGRLGANNVDPDVIIIEGGLNDYSYAQSEQSWPLPWDGTSAAVLDDSFTEAYACMIKKLQTNYPNAIIIALSCCYAHRGTYNGYTYSRPAGDTRYSLANYNDAIKSVCDKMFIPYIDITNIGFNHDNFYPTFASDNADAPAHPNANGHSVMGYAIFNKMKDLIKGYYKEK